MVENNPTKRSYFVPKSKCLLYCCDSLHPLIKVCCLLYHLLFTCKRQHASPSFESPDPFSHSQSVSSLAAFASRSRT